MAYAAGCRWKNWWLLFLAPWLLSSAVMILSVSGVPDGAKILPSSIQPDQGHAVQVQMQHNFSIFFYLPAGESYLRPGEGKPTNHSRLRLYENDRRLRPDYASRDIIQMVGQGASQHVGDTLFFSASDNTDPATNGRRYSTTFKIFLNPIAAGIGILAGCAVSWWPLRRLGRQGIPGKSFATAWLKAGYREARSRLKPGVSRRHVLTYLAVWTIVAVIGTAGVSQITYPTYDAQRSGDRSLLQRLNYYLANRDRYNVIFFGDSQSHLGIHPILINDAAGIRGYNLTYPSTFLPLQYALISELAPKIPKSTTVVLDVTFQNFEKKNDLPIEAFYPVPLKLALQMWLWRLPQTGLLNNVLYFGRFTHFLATRAEVRSDAVSLLSYPLATPTASAQAASEGEYSEVGGMQFAKTKNGLFWRNISAETGPANESAFPGDIPAPSDLPQDKEKNARLIDFYSKIPGVEAVEAIEANGVTNSTMLSFSDGSSCRMEVTPDFFRRQQQMVRPFSEAQARTYPLPAVEPIKVKIFAAMLDALKAQGIHVVVNAIEEAPMFRQHPLRTKRIRDRLQEIVEPLAKSRGYDFIRIDWDAFDDTDYFDTTHLNCRGSQRLAPMLADKLRSVIRP